MLEQLGYGAAVSEERRRWAQRVADEARSVTLRRGRRGYPPDFYRGVALDYLALQDQGVSRGIQKRLAQERGVPWETVRDWVHGATKRGFLGPGQKGKAGRAPGPHLYETTGVASE
jgi:hypothetical protein